jgi:hypothetical protein
MTDRAAAVHGYLLVDGSLAADAISQVADDGQTIAWLHPVYIGDAKLLGPLVIDLETVTRAGQVDEMMSLVNAMSPQLHLSYIETLLSAVELRSHLEQFNVIRTEDGRLFNLRLSDCVVLSMLVEVLSSAQWAALTGSFTRWSVHCRTGQTCELQPAVSIEAPLRVPLTLTESQLSMLAELGKPDVMLANIRALRHGEALAGNAGEQHRWASEARQRWLGAGSGDELVLRWITVAAVDTKGLFLSRPDLPGLLAEGNRESIKSAVADASRYF